MGKKRRTRCMTGTCRYCGTTIKYKPERRSGEVCINCSIWRWVRKREERKKRGRI